MNQDLILEGHSWQKYNIHKAQARWAECWYTEQDTLSYSLE